MNPAGYSGTPLAKKLGIKENSRIRLINPPEHYFDLFTDFPENIKPLRDTKTKKDLIHFFITDINELKKEIPKLKKELESNGCIWISWPKKASNIQTSITEDGIRRIALSNGLVDIKICAIDETWSGLKLVIPLKDRRAL